MDEKPDTNAPGKKPGWLREFLRPPSVVEWLVIAGLILVLAVLFMPNIEEGSAEVYKKMQKMQNTAAPAKP